MSRLKGKNVLTTGASSGIGQPIAVRFGREGANVAINYRSGAYRASKAALVSLIRTISNENHDTCITANIVLPGTMDTSANRAADAFADFTKWVQPAQVAALLVHLASETAAQVNGAAIPICGRDV